MYRKAVGLGRHNLRCLLILTLFMTLPGLAGAQRLAPKAATALQAMEAAAGTELRVRAEPLTGLASFVAAPGGIPVDVPATAPAAERALAFLRAHGQAFGLGDAMELEVRRVSPVDRVGMEHVRLQQLYQGVPVTAGELMIHLRGSLVLSASAKTLDGLEGFDTEPALSATEATAAVREQLERLGLGNATLSAPRLEILNRGLLEGRPFPTRLAYFVEARRIDLRERFWIDAAFGSVLLRFSQLTDARNRLIYDGMSGPALPGTLVRSEGGPPTGDTDADAAYDYSGDTYDYYLSEHGRDSYDDAGADLVSTVHYCSPDPEDPCPFPNAFWNGTQMVYGDGFPAADDVDAHELTHAVTELTADLFYYMQSGALNESFSDIFGETVDLTNAAGTDSAGVRWLMGEDVPGGGAIRDMMDPNTFSDPARVGDALFWCDATLDNGGVHINSGIQNHAYALMVDGGTFNAVTVTGIGLTKAGKVAYRVLSQYLLSGSGFHDAYDSWGEACLDLAGYDGITAADCAQVQNALDAVEMDGAWPCAVVQASVPDPCQEGQEPVDTFYDDFESGGGNWSVATFQGANPWILTTGFATSGTTLLYSPDVASTTDSRAFMTSAVTVPTAAYLHFNHAFEFETSGGSYWDGGVIQYSTNGAVWNDAAALITDGASYNGTLEAGNPLGAVSAYVDNSFGYTSTKLDLSGLAGQSFQFGFRIGTDLFVGDLGWLIDDVRIYQCVEAGSIFADGFESGNTSRWSSTVP